MLIIFSLIAVLSWIYLTGFRGLFWLEKPQAWPESAPLTTPEVAIVVPARNEQAVIGRAVRALIRQDYTGPYRIFLVDDHSTDATVKEARETADRLFQGARLSVVPAPPLPEGWGGKLWAMQTGLRAAQKDLPGADYILFTDADIEHDPSSLRELVARAEKDRLALASFMVKLHCRSLPEKFLIPAFVFFFMLLYPFAWVRNAGSPVAAAAGGAMLARKSALAAAGGLSVIRDEWIDDCALARLMKKQGPLWIGLAGNTFSVRPYATLKSIWKMIARSAYSQLRHSPLLLLVTVAAMALVFFVPAAALVLGSPAVQFTGFCGLGLMALIYLPMVRFYGLQPYWILTLPGAAAVYLLATLDSARHHWKGHGGEWKGRARRPKSPLPPDQAS